MRAGCRGDTLPAPPPRPPPPCPALRTFVLVPSSPPPQLGGLPAESAKQSPQAVQFQTTPESGHERWPSPVTPRGVRGPEGTGLRRPGRSRSRCQRACRRRDICHHRVAPALHFCQMKMSRQCPSVPPENTDFKRATPPGRPVPYAPCASCAGPTNNLFFSMCFHSNDCDSVKGWWGGVIRSLIRSPGVMFRG